MRCCRMIKFFSRCNFILVCFLLVGCSDVNVQSNHTGVQEEAIEEMTIYKLESGTKRVIISDKKDIATIENSIKGAIQQPGIVNMAEPHFRLKMGDETFLLWTSTDSGTIGTIMDTKDTHTIYTMSEKLTSVLNEVLIENQLLD